MANSVRSLIYGYMWEFSQVLIGANAGKMQLHLVTLKPEKDARILDFACSTGNASAVFSGYDYTGLDIDPRVIRFAQHKFRNHPNMKFICQNVLDFEDHEGFDYVICGSAGHHIPNHELVPILRKLSELLRQGGVIGVFDPIRTGKEGPVLRFLMRIDQGKYHKTREEYLALFAECHLRVITQDVAKVRGPFVTYYNYAAFALQPELP